MALLSGFDKTIILSNAGSQATFRRNQTVFGVDYWFYKSKFDLLLGDEYNER